MPESATATPPSADVVRLPTLSVSQREPLIAVLRLWKPSADHFAALSGMFGFAWPSEPNRVAGDDARVLWLAPDIWAIVGLPVTTIRECARQALGARLHHVSEVSEGRCVFAVAGALARPLLGKGCSLDLHPRVFHDGCCAQSLLAQVPVLIEVLAVAETQAINYRLYADVSYAGYLRAWLADAAAEFS